MIRIITTIILIAISSDIINDNGNNNDGEKICSKDKNY